MQKKTIIITSNEAWGDVWFSKQHYANELASLGHTVYFVNPSTKWSLSKLFSTKTTNNPVNENLTIINLNNNLPQTIFKRFFVKINDYLNSVKIKRHLNDDNKNLILWKFDPYRFIHYYPLNPIKVIYHVVDPYTWLWQDELHVASSDLIICTNSQLLKHYNSLKSDNVILVPHGVSKNEFSINSKEKNNIKNEFGDFSLIVGTITQSINLELFSKISENKNNLVIIGPEKINSIEWSQLKDRRNIYFLGPIHAEKLKTYIAASKVCLISYHLTDKETLRSPIKSINYLAQMKPIVSSINIEIPDLLNEGIFVAKNEMDYLNLVALGLKDELRVNHEKYSSYLNEITYESLIGTIFNTLENTSTKRASL